MDAALDERHSHHGDHEGHEGVGYFDYGSSGFFVGNLAFGSLISFTTKTTKGSDACESKPHVLANAGKGTQNAVAL
jgi:hypothetical protein